MNKKVIFTSLAAGLAAGTATWLLYDKVVAFIENHKTVEEPVEQVNPVDEALLMDEYESIVSENYIHTDIQARPAEKAESPSEDLLIYPIDLDKFMAWDEDERHVCTWYRKQEVLAGMDDDLEVLDLYETFGDYGSHLVQTCEASALYLLRADDGQAFEIVMSDDDYDSDYAEYQVIRESIGSPGEE